MSGAWLPPCASPGSGGITLVGVRLGRPPHLKQGLSANCAAAERVAADAIERLGKSKANSGSDRPLLGVSGLGRQIEPQPPSSRAFRNTGSPKAMALGFIEGDMALLETLGFLLALLMSVWFWTHC